MTTNQILNLDCRKEENKEIIQKALKLIKPFRKYDENTNVKQSDLEKLIRIICLKYNIRIHSLRAELFSNETEIIWKATLINESNLKMEQFIYGLSTYEVLAKICIKMHKMVKSNKLDLRKESK